MKEVESATGIITRERDLNSIAILTVGIVLAIVTMTFGAMITAFLIRSQGERFWGHIKIPGILWATTAFLLISSAAFEAARRRLIRDDQRAFFRLTAYATGFGVLFLCGQLTAWYQILHSGLILARNPHSWFIFFFTGLHGLHIVVGLAALGYLLFRTREPVSGPKYQMNTRVIANGVSVFWHYLDFLWLVLFGLLLAWRP